MANEMEKEIIELIRSEEDALLKMVQKDSKDIFDQYTKGLAEAEKRFLKKHNLTKKKFMDEIETDADWVEDWDNEVGRLQDSIVSGKEYEIEHDEAFIEITYYAGTFWTRYDGKQLKIKLAPIIFQIMNCCLRTEKPVGVLHVPWDITKKVDVTTKAGIFHIAQVLGKPVLEIQNAQFTHGMISTDEKEYHVLVVIDNAIIYIFKEDIPPRPPISEFSSTSTPEDLEEKKHHEQYKESLEISKDDEDARRETAEHEDADCPNRKEDEHVKE